MGHGVTLLLRLVATFVALAAVGCDGAAVTTLSSAVAQGDDDALLQATSASGRVRSVLRIDGHPTLVKPMSVTADEPQTLIVTDHTAGEDQCSLLVFGPAGELLTRYRVAGDLPSDIDSSTRAGGAYSFLAPGGSTVRTIAHRGRRMIAFATATQYVPYSLVVLEAVERTRLVPRLRFWHYGGIHPPVFEDGLLAVRVTGNPFKPEGQPQRYPVAVAVLSLDEVLDSVEDDTPFTAIGPASESRLGRGYLNYFLLPAVDTPYSETVGPRMRLESGVLHVQMVAGEIYLLGARDGSVRVTGVDGFAAAYALRRQADPELPDLATYLEDLRSRVRVFRPR